MPSRTAYLSGDVAPQVKATIRRLRLDFGDTLYHNNDEHVIDGTNYRGDDYADQIGDMVIWGDSCVAAASPYGKVRVLAAAAWTSGGSSSMWRSLATAASDDWTLSSLSGPATLHGYCRPGLYPVAASTSVYGWYVGSDGKLYRSTLNTSTWSWSGTTTGLDLSSHTACAVHPISSGEAVVVAFTAPCLWLKHCYWNGSAWSSTADWVVHMSRELTWSDAHWSDAEISPDDSDEVVIALNLSAWGSAHAVIHNKVSGLWSQPREILPSAEQWGNLKVRVSALSTINGRIWAVTTREPVASRDIPMAHHVALASTRDGRHWADGYYVTRSTLRGKLLYEDTETYCYVAGNASVARGNASSLLGAVSGMSYTVNEAYGMEMAVSGVGSAQEVTVMATNKDDALSGSGFLEAGNQLEVEIGAVGSSYADYCKAILALPRRAEEWAGDDVSLAGYGHSWRILGQGAYRPVAAKVYENAYVLHSNFNMENGLARLTMRQVTGTWDTARLPDVGRYALHCSTAGLCLVPHEFACQSFIVRAAMKGGVAIEGNYIVFWYEDEDNYWRAGLYLDPVGDHRLVIAKYESGSTTFKSQQVVTVTKDAWYTLFLDVRPGRVRVHFPNADTYDYSFGTTTIAYDATAESEGPPAEYHIGLESEPFSGTEGADDSGTVDSSTSNSITDTSKSFGSDVLGKWLHCNDQHRQVIDYTSTKLTINPGWSSKPEVGDVWALYTNESTNGPQFYCKEIFVSEAKVPWTTDDIVDSILALSGVARSDVFTGDDVPTLGSSSPSMYDVDLKVYSSQGICGECQWWCSSQNTTGEAACSCLSFYAGASSSFLDAIVGLGSPSSPYQQTIPLGAHPHMVSVPGVGTGKTIRVQANGDTVFISCDGHFLTAYPVTGQHIGGLAAKINSGDTCTTTEFPAICDLIWDANGPAAAALQRLLEGRRAKVVERTDGSVAVSRFDDAALGDLGTYSTPLVAMVTGDAGYERVALVEMVGAEERAFYLDHLSARRNLNFARADNPTLDTQEQALNEARRLAMLARQRAEAVEVQLYITDPAMELEDEFQIGSDTYIVDGYQFSIQKNEDGTPQATAQVRGRAAPDSISGGTYGSANYDSSTQWGE